MHLALTDTSEKKNKADYPLKNEKGGRKLTKIRTKTTFKLISNKRLAKFLKIGVLEL